VAGKGERNRLTITDSRKGVVFSDPGARMRRVPGDLGDCRFARHRHRATCDVDRTIDVFVSLRDRDDSVRFKGSNAGPLGPSARTAVKDAADFADVYYDFDGANTEHGYLSGGSGNDRVLGTDGNDVLDGGPGRDLVDGGKGPDRIVDRPDAAPDRLRGGKGVDSVDGAGASALTIDLRAKTLVSGDETDTLDSFEIARGGAGADTLLGSDAADGLFGDHGSDSLDGRGGGDYLGGDLEVQDVTDGGSPGQDMLTGGAGDDVLDARDSGDLHALTPTDQLLCGDGSDRIIALQDDLADPSCESSATGEFSGDLIFDQKVSFDPPLTAVNPVARGADGAPTYSIGCSGGLHGQDSCSGHIQLERPPVTGTETQPQVLGRADYEIAGGRSKDVTVILNDAGKAALAEPGARISVLLDEAGAVGWQQVLGP
jgi:Ca2+-binding RTX toxin-like protein